MCILVLHVLLFLLCIYSSVYIFDARACQLSLLAGDLLYSSSPMISQILHRSFLRASVFGKQLSGPAGKTAGAVKI